MTLAGVQGGLWQWRKNWNNGEEEMTVKSKSKICIGLNTNVDLESSLVIVAGTVGRQVEQVVMMLERFASPIPACFASPTKLPLGCPWAGFISCK